MMYYITSTKSLSHKSRYLSWENLDPNISSALTFDCFNPHETSCQAAVGRGERNPEIMAISNQDNNTLNNPIDRSDLDSSDWAKQIFDRLSNILSSESSSSNLLERDFLNKNV